MKGFKLSGIIGVILVGAFLFMGAQLTFVKKGSVLVKQTSTYADSQTDTITYNFEGTESDLVFFANWKDSVKVTNAIIVRYYNGVAMAHTAATDTLFAATTGMGPWARLSTTDTVCVKALTEAPQAEQYKFIVRYGTGQGTTSPTVHYGIIRVHTK